jgi:hypothetical protein
MISFQGYLFSSAEKIIGIEIDVNFCQLQQRMIEKYNMTDRINVSCDEQCLLSVSNVKVHNRIFLFDLSE